MALGWKEGEGPSLEGEKDRFPITKEVREFESNVTLVRG
jgi:hypothetical protein